MYTDINGLKAGYNTASGMSCCNKIFRNNKNSYLGYNTASGMSCCNELDKGANYTKVFTVEMVPQQKNCLEAVP